VGGGGPAIFRDGQLRALRRIEDVDPSAGGVNLRLNGSPRTVDGIEQILDVGRGAECDDSALRAVGDFKAVSRINSGPAIESRDRRQRRHMWLRRRADQRIARSRSTRIENSPGSRIPRSAAVVPVLSCTLM